MIAPRFHQPVVGLSLLCVALGGVSCVDDDPVPAFIEMNYQVRCLGTCDDRFDSPTHRVANVDGEEGFELECRVRGDGDSRVLSFSVKCRGDAECGATEYSLDVRDVGLDGREITDPGAGCRIIAEEGANAYEGRCTVGNPAADRPCSISGEISGTTVTGTLLCEEIPSDANRSDTRFLVAPVSREETEFRLEGCEGLDD